MTSVNPGPAASTTSNTNFPLVPSNYNRRITSTTFTLNTSDQNARLSFTAATGVSLTIPQGLPVGFEVTIEQLGGGQITVIPALNVTLTNVSGNTKTAGQYAVCCLLGNLADSYNWVGNTG